MTMNETVENKGVVYEFGRFVLDPRERILLHGGQPIHLSDKVFDTLVLLTENNGRLLTKEEMIAALWDESFVEESNLAKNISRLRKILNVNGSPLIETLPKRGYRFVADVKTIDGPVSVLVHRNLRLKITHTRDDQVAAAGARHPITASRLITPLAIAAAAVGVAVVSLLGVYYRNAPPTPSFAPRGGPVRLTFSATHEDTPQWTLDDQIRFVRYTSSTSAESFVMNPDGTDQRRSNSEIKDLRTGYWSPDGKKVIFRKENDETGIYLSDSNGANEIKMPFAFGNHNWSPDSRSFVYQAADGSNKRNSELYIYTVETGKSTRLTNHPAFDADPSFSPDGRQIAFSSDRDGPRKIYLMNSDGTDLRPLAKVVSGSFPVFSPDGTQLIFGSSIENENGDVYLANLNDDSPPVKLTDWPSNEENRQNCWSPDGTKIVFLSDQSGKSNIYVLDVEPFKPRLVLGDENADLTAPSFSPDGSKIAYQARLEDKTGELRVSDTTSRVVRTVIKGENADLSPAWAPRGNVIAFNCKSEGNTDVCAVADNGDSLANLTRNAARDTSPTWSPDGTEIIFASNRDGNLERVSIFRMDADGRNQRRVSQKSGFEMAPAWSPDGKFVVFAGDRQDGLSNALDIFSMAVDDPSVEKILAVRRFHDSSPAISADGKRIVFVGQGDGNPEIYLMNSDGTGLLRLTRNVAEDVTPQFSRDGKRIIFSSNRSGRFALYELDLPAT